MKKIILAVASVLALGLFASCQREISGDLNVNETTFGATQTVYTYTDFDVTGTITDTTKVTRKVGTADATTETTVTTKTPYGKIERRIEKRRVDGDNRTLISFCGKYNRKQVYTPAGSTTSTTTVTDRSNWNHDDPIIRVKKVNGAYYIHDTKADVQVEGDTVTIKCTLTDSETATTGDGTAAGNTVTTTERTAVYDLTLTKR